MIVTHINFIYFSHSKFKFKLKYQNVNICKPTEWKLYGDNGGISSMLNCIEKPNDWSHWKKSESEVAERTLLKAAEVLCIARSLAKVGKAIWETKPQNGDAFSTCTTITRN